MSCNVWEEKGLLYSSGELVEDEIRDFEEHLKVCKECSEEWNLYLSSKKFFSPDILGELPSEECDREILRVCGDGRKQVAYLHLPFVYLMLRRTFVSVVVFLFGFITIGLISLQVDTLKQDRRIISYKNSVKLAEKYDTSKIKSDTSSDSSENSSLQFRSKGGSINNAGVYPVDLKSR